MAINNTGLEKNMTSITSHVDIKEKKKAESGSFKYFHRLQVTLNFSPVVKNDFQILKKTEQNRRSILNTPDLYLN